MDIKKIFCCLFVALLLISTFGSIPVDGENVTDYDNSKYPFTEHYPSVEELYRWYETLESEYPDLVTRHNIGKSWEGRDLWVIELTASNDTRVDSKPAILIDGGMHAREWSSIQVAAYLMWRLLNEYDTNETIYWLVNNRRIFVYPVVNPDGYVYDGDGVYKDGLQGRWWRKNRNGSIHEDEIGVDLNRNWDHLWSRGTDKPGRADYRGVEPFSENETFTLRDFILDNDIQSYQNLHSYWGTLLIPWSHANIPTFHEDWYRATAEQITSHTSRFGNHDVPYSYGRAEEEIGYSAPGGSTDWVYDKTGAHTFCFEIFTGEHFFYPPIRRIMDINQDLDDALIHQCRIADTDLGDGDELLFPPIPFLIFGNVIDINDDKLSDNDVYLTNQRTEETIWIETDSNGYYELNLGNLVEHGYEGEDTFTLTVEDTMLNFTTDDGWGARFDLTTDPDSKPAKVVGLEVVESNGMVNLTWDPPDDNDFSIYRYNVYRNGDLIGHSQTNSYSDTEPVDGGTYRISAVSSGGEGPMSDSIKACRSDYDIPYIMVLLVIVGVLLFAAIYIRKHKGTADEEPRTPFEREGKEKCPHCHRKLFEVSDDFSAYCEGCGYATMDSRDLDSQTLENGNDHI